MDTSLYRTVNRFADRTSWLHGPAVAYAKYGVVIFAGLLLLAWWRARQAGDLETEARIGWAGAATLIALGLGQIIGHLVDRARPYAVLPHVHVLVSKSADVSFPSDHALTVGAIAIGLWLVDHTLGWIAIALALLMAFTRVYVGAHYPTDVVAGLVIAGLIAAAGARSGSRLLKGILIHLERIPGGRWITGRDAKGNPSA
jgi:membrane-associated phospholipid phosphatase